MNETAPNPPSRRAIANKLPLKSQFHLAALVQAEYAAKRITDVEFAKYATEKLGVTVLPSNIQGVRHAFDIPGNKVVLATEKARPEGRLAGLEAAILDLTTRVQWLEERVRGLMKDLGE